MVEFGQHLVHRQIVARRFELAHQRQALVRDDQHLERTCLAMAPAVLARHVHVEIMVGMLDHRNPQPRRAQQADDLLEHGGLARAGIACETNGLHMPNFYLLSFS
ncbi:hypothetical protein SDC9_144609 [bioreactor metagenome]|uniref:Uncharacterized protein n=1 Tax=bioreactor metagenome TaxID=1076179 RepID=A0A645E781_9ZZZZ